MSDEPIQLSITKIAADVYRIVVQSASRIVYTANVEEKHLQKTIDAELARLAVLPMDWSF